MYLSILSVMPIGRYQGEFVGTIIEDDPGYITWLINNTNYRLDEDALAYLEQQG